MVENLFKIKGKVAVVTGSYGVLGGAMASYLATQGVKVAILGRKEEKVAKKCRSIQEAGGTSMAAIADVLSREDLQKVKDQILAAWGSIDILINAAGGNLPGATIAPSQTIFDLSIEDFEKVTDLNLYGTVLPTLVFGEVIAKQKKGSIINISSMTVQRALTRVVGYSAGKAAIDNFTRWMAVEMAQKFGEGIRVNALAPGFFIGDQNRRLLLNEDGGLTSRGKAIIRQTPVGRFGEAEELCGAIHWLCSDASKFVTGIVVPVDGGFSAFSGV